jgi:hypothetical protein
MAENSGLNSNCKYRGNGRTARRYPCRMSRLPASEPFISCFRTPNRGYHRSPSSRHPCSGQTLDVRPRSVCTGADLSRPRRTRTRQMLPRKAWYLGYATWQSITPDYSTLSSSDHSAKSGQFGSCAAHPQLRKNSSPSILTWHVERIVVGFSKSIWKMIVSCRGAVDVEVSYTVSTPGHTTTRMASR